MDRLSLCKLHELIIAKVWPYSDSIHKGFVNLMIMRTDGVVGIPRRTQIKPCLYSEFWFRSSPLIYLADREWGIFYACNLTVWGGVAGFAEAGSATLTSLDLI
jgi:hypothetical protein